MTDETLFEQALQIPVAERGSFLDRACEGNPALRAEVEALLKADADPVTLLDPQSPPADRFTHSHGPQSPALPAEAVGNFKDMILAGKYRLIERIGEGGMGEVWLANQTTPVKRLVAVKLIKAGMDSKQVLSRFETERQALAMMDHPNIAKVFDGGLHHGRPYFVMELVKGVPITEYCDNQKLTPNQRLELFIPVCQAIQHAHQKGVIHRDIKPSNVLIAMYDDQAVPKVIDFGVAKATGSTISESTLITGFGGIVGTPQYMSPEQATVNNLDIDTRSDVYSLGVLLYELLAGSPPFAKAELEKRGILEILRIVREDEPPKPSAKLSTADALPSLSASRGTDPKKLTGLLKNDLDWIVMKSLEKDRSRRYETANGFAADVNRYLSGEPVLAHPPSTMYRLKKYTRRHLGPIVIAGIIMAITFNSLGFASLQWLMARDAEKRALQERDEKNIALQAESTARLQAERNESKAFAEKKLADANHERAVQESNNANAVMRFLQRDILLQADSGVQAADRYVDVNPHLTVREALDRASAKIGQRFQGQERVELSIRRAIAEAYLGLNEGAKAAEHLEYSRTVHTRHWGADDSQTLEIQVLLVHAYILAHRFSDAVKLGEDTLERYKKLGGLESDDALKLKNALAGVYSETKQSAKAIAIYEEIFRINQTRHGRSHDSTLSVMNNLAIAYEFGNRLEDARKLYDECLSLRRKHHGDEHPDTLLSMNNAGSFYWRRGQLDRSILLFEESLRLRNLKIGPDHPLTLRTAINLGINYRDAQRIPDAIAVLEESIRRGRQRTEADIINLGPATDALIEIYTSQFNHRKAEPHIRWLAEKALKEEGPDSLAEASWNARLGLNLLVQKRYEEAEPLMKKCLAVRQKKDPLAWSTFNTHSFLGGAQLGQKKYSEAEPNLIAGAEGLIRTERSIPKEGRPRLFEAIDRLIELYTETKRPDDVKKWQAIRAKYMVGKP